MAEQQGPKIIIDSDWKSQAQAEKQRLAETERRPAPATGAPGAAPEGAADQGGPAGPEGPPRASFEELVRMLATQALLYLGAFPDPETGRAIVALDLAKLNVDMLGILEEKTKGNLTEQEAALLSRILYELRMQFVEISKAVSKAVEEGRIGKAEAPGIANK